MKFYVLKNMRGCYLSQGLKYIAQPYVAQLTPEFKPVIRYQIVDMIADDIIKANMTENDALEWLEEVTE